MVGKYPVITLCGSTKYKDEFLQAQSALTLDGNIVLSIGVFGHTDNINLTSEVKAMLDDIHKRKIDMSDAIYIINKDGYIGDSTRSEIEYAKEHNKQIYYMFEEYITDGN